MGNAIRPKFAAVSAMLVAFVAVPAQAALDLTSFDAAVAEVETTASSAAASVLPVMAAVLAIVIGVKVLKRLANKI